MLATSSVGHHTKNEAVLSFVGQMNSDFGSLFVIAERPSTAYPSYPISNDRRVIAEYSERKRMCFFEVTAAKVFSFYIFEMGHRIP